MISVTTNHRLHTILLTTALLIACSMAGWSAQQQIVLTERLNARWAHELVTYPFTAEQGACVAESVRLSGPAGEVPVQLSNIETWPNSQFVKSATLAFVVDSLPPLATNSYQVSYGPVAVKDAAPAADLRVTVTEANVEAVTSRFGVRLLLGAKTFTPPVASSTVPGPMQAMCRADGGWFGGSRMFGDTPITGYTATLTDRGPAFVKVAYHYSYQDGNTLDLTVRLDAQSNQVYYETVVKDNKKADGWDVLLTPGLPALNFQFMREVQALQTGALPLDKDNNWRGKDIADYPPGLVTNLTPWGDWWSEFTQTKFYLAYLDTRPQAAEMDPEKATPKLKNPEDAPDARELVIARQVAGDWVTPGGEYQKQVPLLKGADGTLLLHVNNASGMRKFSIGENPSYKAKLATFFRPQNTFQDELEPLNVVKDMVLEWPASAEKHPRLILSAEEVALAAKQNPAALKQLQDVARLREMLGKYAYYDTMRNAADVICLYDGIIDSELIKPADRQLFRAQMAYLAYRLANPSNWSPERGFNSGNPNMTVAHTLNQGFAACTLRDHPMAKSWCEKPMASMEAWMNRLDSSGYWNESGHYGRVSVSKLMLFAIALQKAGFKDYFTDPRMKHMALFYEKSLTPPDPQKVLNSSPKNETVLGRLSPPIGRGSHGSNWGLGGLMAKGFAKSDPALSKVLQWSFHQTNYSALLGEGMSGLDALYTDRNLPEETPTDWNSEFFPSVGPLFRSGVGTPEENYLWLVTKTPTNPDGQFWPSEVGSLLIWFAKGKPISRRFPSVPDMNHDHGLLCDRVMLATNWKPGQSVSGGYYAVATQQGLALLPRLNYAATDFEWKGNWNQVTPPKAIPDFPKVPKVGQLPPAGEPSEHWLRQAMWVHDDAPGGVQYLVLRDTMTGGQPTQWQFWTESEKIGTPEEVADRQAFLADAPGQQSVMGHELTGNRFTALGSLGVDIEYYIASPTDTPRNTLRYCTRSFGYWVRDFQLAQDLMHLQLHGDGAYFVALFPRLSTEDVPTFTTLGDGTVIKVAGKFGADYAFLASKDTHAVAEDAIFAGTAASVQHRQASTILALGAPGAVSWQVYGLTAAQPATLTITDKQLTVKLPSDHAETQLTVQAKGAWKLPTPAGVKLERQGDQYLLTVPAGVVEVKLEK